LQDNTSEHEHSALSNSPVEGSEESKVAKFGFTNLEDHNVAHEENFLVEGKLYSESHVSISFYLFLRYPIFW